MNTLCISAMDFHGNVDQETSIYAETFIKYLGGEQQAINALKAQKAVFDKYEEWPCSLATPEEIAIYEKVESAENIAWKKAFAKWLMQPGERGEHFEYSY